MVCNAEDRDRLGRLFDDYQFAAVLDCAGNCALKSCELDPAMAWRINVEGVRNLLEICIDRHGSLRPSVDRPGLFRDQRRRPRRKRSDRSGDGLRQDDGCGREIDPRRQLPEACTLRISLPMGISFNGHAGAIDWIQSRFKKSQAGHALLRRNPHADLHRLPELSCAKRCWPSDLTGLYHAGGPRRLSLYQIAQIINRVGGYDPTLLMGCPRNGRSDSAAGRQRVARFHQADRRPRLQSVRSLAASPRSSCQRIASGTSNATDSKAPRSCWRMFCTAILARLGVARTRRLDSDTQIDAPLHPHH